MAGFSATRHASPTAYGMAVKLEPKQLPEAFAWLAAKFLPAFDRQLTIRRAAHTAWKINAIWPYRTGRSVRSWELGIGHVPEANSPPGPRPVFSVDDAAQRLEGVKPGQEVFHVNAARKPPAATSYAQGLWEGRFSPQLSTGAEKPLLGYLKSVEREVVRQAEAAAIDEVL